MSHRIILKKDPKIEFHILDNGIQLVDEQSHLNSGFYAYHDLRSVELDKAWYPRLAEWMRIFTTLINGAPFFPDSDSCKKAKIVLHLKSNKIAMWLTDTTMASQAKKLKASIDRIKCGYA